MSSIAVSVDLQQAYDRMWRKWLLNKLLDTGIYGKLRCWLRCFLIESDNQTIINGAGYSNEVPEEGLPQ